MSDDDRFDHGSDAGPDPQPGPSSAEAQVARAMHQFAAQVQPDGDAWARIDRRLDDGAGRGSTAGSVGGRGVGVRPSPWAERRPVLVAAVFVVFVVLAGAVVVRARSSSDVEVATAPGLELALVGLTRDGRLVELGLDGRERREIYRSPDDGSRLEGRIAVSPLDRTIYVQRIRPSDFACGDAGVDTPEGAVEGLSIGELVAVPFDGGEPTTVASVGRDPDVAPGANRLVYRTGVGPCSAAEADIGIVDLNTGATGVVSIVGSVDAGQPDATARVQGGVAAVMGGEVHVPLLFPTVMEARWAVDGASLDVLVGHGSGVPYRAVVDIELTVGAATVTPAGAEVLLSPIPEASSTLTNQFGALTGVAAFDVGRAGSSEESFVFVKPNAQDPSSLAVVLDGSIGIHATSVPSGSVPPEPRQRRAITTEARATFDVAALGVGPLGDTDVEVEPLTGRVLVVARASGFGGSGPENLVVVIDGVAAQPLPTSLSLMSAAWVWSDRPAIPDPTTTAPTDLAMPGTTADLRALGTTIPIDPFATWVPTTVAAAEPQVPLTERPEDAAAVAEAYDALFERGDRGAFEGGASMEPILEEAAQATPGGPTGATVRVTGIEFVAADTARVTFLLDHPSWGAPVSVTGGAVRIDGRWKVSTSTMCMLFGRVGVACPGI